MPSMHNRIILLKPALLAIAAVMFIAAAFIAATDSNKAIFLSWNVAGSALHPAIWTNLTLMADTLWAIALLLAVAVYRPKLLTQSLLLLIIGGITVHIFKQSLNLPRPPAVLEASNFNLIGPALKNESFPSGHAFTALSCATLLALNTLRPALIVFIMIAGVLAALSRVMVGAHWPVDILTGGGAGIVMAVFCSYLESHCKTFEAHGWKFASILLLTLATIALAFHEDRYPYTQVLGVMTSLTALVIAGRQFWLPFFRLLKRSS